MKMLGWRRMVSAFSLMRFRSADLLRNAGYCRALTEPRRAEVAVVSLSFRPPALVGGMVLVSIRS